MKILGFAREICREEKGAREVDIAQMLEILSIINTKLKGKLYEEIALIPSQCFGGIPPSTVSTDIEERVIKVIAEVLAIKEGDIKKSDKFEKDLGVDSLDIVEICMGIEEEFDITIPDEDLKSLGTVGLMIDYVSACLQAKEEK